MGIYSDPPPLTFENAKELFPNLDEQGFKITSEQDRFYNCFAWGAEDADNRWEPSTASDKVWFARSMAPTVPNFIETYGYVGFVEPAITPELEDGIEKLALYVSSDGEVLHAARQQADGSWTSKLGNREDVEHRTLQCLEGEEYGTVQMILQRPRGDAETWKKNALEHHLKNIKTSKN